MSLDFGKLDFVVSLNRKTAFPLDARSYFESLASAEAAARTAEAAGSKNTTYYFGQTICVVENNVASMYIIQPDGTLGEIGEKVKIDEKQFEFKDGSLSLIGFADAVAEAQLVKNADGTLGWVKPDNSVVQGLSTDVENLKTAIGVPADEENEASGIYAKLDEKANVADVYSKEDADQAIASAIAGVSHLKREIFDSKIAAENAMVDYGDSADQYIYMVHRGLLIEDGNYYDEYMAFKQSDGWILEKIGDWNVDLSEYAKINDVNTELSKKVDKVEGSRLITNVEVQKLSRVEDGAQVNYISAVDTNFVVSEGKLSLNSVDISKVNGLQNILAEKVDKVYYTIENEDGSTSRVEGTLLSPVDKAKLNALVIDESGSVGISGTVNASKVEGLGDWITENGINYISNLTENNLSAVIVEKINFITSVDTNTFSTKEGKLELVNVPAQALYSTVGDLTKIQNYVVGNTLVDNINDILEILTWTDMV